MLFLAVIYGEVRGVWAFLKFSLLSEGQKIKY